MVLFGGLRCCSVGLSDTWTWDGATWTKLLPAHSPSGRGSLRMAYDEAERKIVLFGGFDPSIGVYDDTSTWDGTDWTQAATSDHPPGRYAFVMGYAASAHRVVLFGGLSAYLHDTWSWNGSTWTSQNPTPSAPAGRGGPAGAYDELRDQLVMFGGIASDGRTFLGDTWSLS